MKEIRKEATTEAKTATRRGTRKLAATTTTRKPRTSHGSLNKWTEEVKQFREQHPGMSYKDAMKQLSVLRKHMGNEIPVEHIGHELPVIMEEELIPEAPGLIVNPPGLISTNNVHTVEPPLITPNTIMAEQQGLITPNTLMAETPIILPETNEFTSLRDVKDVIDEIAMEDGITPPPVEGQGRRGRGRPRKSIRKSIRRTTGPRPRTSIRKTIREIEPPIIGYGRRRRIVHPVEGAGILRSLWNNPITNAIKNAVY